MPVLGPKLKVKIRFKFVNSLIFHIFLKKIKLFKNVDQELFEKLILNETFKIHLSKSSWLKFWVNFQLMISPQSTHHPKIESSKKKLASHQNCKFNRKKESKLRVNQTL